MIKVMRITGLVLTLALFSSSGSSKVHPLKMSFSKLVISKDGVVDLKTRIFLDDITEQIQKQYGLSTVEFTTIESNGTEALQRYLKDHFFFEQDNQKIELTIKVVSFSQNKLAVALDLVTKNPIDVSKKLFLTNTVLCEASPKQLNDLMYLNQHIRLSAKTPTAEIPFN